MIEATELVLTDFEVMEKKVVATQVVILGMRESDRISYHHLVQIKELQTYGPVSISLGSLDGLVPLSAAQQAQIDAVDLVEDQQARRSARLILELHSRDLTMFERHRPRYYSKPDTDTQNKINKFNGQLQVAKRNRQKHLVRQLEAQIADLTRSCCHE